LQAGVRPVQRDHRNINDRENIRRRARHYDERQQDDHQCHYDERIWPGKS
jgi:hypothetical protein